MTEEEFRAQMEGIDEGQKTPPLSLKKLPQKAPPSQTYIQPSQTRQVNPGAYQTRAPTPRPAVPPARRLGGFSGATVPLTVRQSQKDGSFGLSGKLTFSIKIDQEAFQHVTFTGEGLAGKDANGKWQEGFKVGELTVWPPFEKKQG